MLAHLAEVGPLAVNVDASQWHSYTGNAFAHLLRSRLYSHQFRRHIMIDWLRWNLWRLRLCSEHGPQSCGADGERFYFLVRLNSFGHLDKKPCGIQFLCPWYDSPGGLYWGCLDCEEQLGNWVRFEITIILWKELADIWNRCHFVKRTWWDLKSLWFCEKNWLIFEMAIVKGSWKELGIKAATILTSAKQI